MWTIGLYILVAVLVIFISQYWRNNARYSNGVVLPPGSMGLPFIGETLHLIFPSYSLDLHPFIKKRIQRYGPIFRTNLAGRPVVISVDPEFNNYVFAEEGRTVELYYMDTFSNIFKHEGESRTNAHGSLHKYIRGIFLTHFGAQSLKNKLIPLIEQFVDTNLRAWSNQSSIEVKHEASAMVLNFCAKQIFGHDPEKSSEDLSEMYSRILDGLMSFPLNIPGTAYHRCSKSHEKATNMLRNMLKDKVNNSAEQKSGGDLVDQMIRDMDKEKYLSKELVVQMLYSALFATFESVSAVIALAFQLLSDHPSVLQELTAEQDAVFRRKKDPNSPLTWDDYKSMTFTLQVINETLRLGNVAPGLLRKVLKDIEVKGKGFTIPAGWTIMVVTSALQMNPDTYKNPLEFNPWRWKEMDSDVISKNFSPFGGGTRQCAGAEFSRAFMCIFFHVLLTKYRWTKIKGATISRNPILGFGKGIHIRFAQQYVN